jgi:hypothetical protein
MYDAQPCEQRQRIGHSGDEVLQQGNISADLMIEISLVNHVDSLVLVKFALNIKKVLIESLAFT